MTRKFWHVLTVVMLAVMANGTAAADMGRLVKSPIITIDSNGSTRSHQISLDQSL